MTPNSPITVTSPLLPPLHEFIPYLEDIWKRKWITNNGHYHQELEKALCAYLKVPYIQSVYQWYVAVDGGVTGACDYRRSYYHAI